MTFSTWDSQLQCVKTCAVKTGLEQLEKLFIGLSDPQEAHIQPYQITLAEVKLHATSLLHAHPIVPEQDSLWSCSWPGLGSEGRIWLR